MGVFLPLFSPALAFPIKLKLSLARSLEPGSASPLLAGGACHSDFQYIVAFPKAEESRVVMT